VEEASGKVNVLYAVVPVVAQVPSPISLHGCPGFGVAAKSAVVYIIVKEAPPIRRIFFNFLIVVLDTII
jgi:predicted solute-binding protein